MLQSVRPWYDRHCIHWLRQDDGICAADSHVLPRAGETPPIRSQRRPVWSRYLSIGEFSRVIVPNIVVWLNLALLSMFIFYSVMFWILLVNISVFVALGLVLVSSRLCDWHEVSKILCQVAKYIYTGQVLWNLVWPNNWIVQFVRQWLPHHWTTQDTDTVHCGKSHTLRIWSVDFRVLSIFLSLSSSQDVYWYFSSSSPRPSISSRPSNPLSTLLVPRI